MNQPPIEEGRYYHIYNRANGSDNLFRQKEDYLHFLELYQKYIPPIADTFAWVLMPNHFHILVRIKEERIYKYSKADFNKANVARAANAARSANAVRSATADADGLRWEDVKWETIARPNSSASEDPNSSASEGPNSSASEGPNSSASEGPDDVRLSDNVRNKIIKPANATNHISHLCNAHAKYINQKYGRHGSLFQRPFKRKIAEDEAYQRQLVLYLHNNGVHHGFVNRTEDYLWSSYHAYLSQDPTWLLKAETLSWFGDIQRFVTAHNRYPGNMGNLEGDWLEED